MHDHEITHTSHEGFLQVDCWQDFNFSVKALEVLEMARIYILEGGEWESPPSEEEREYMLRLQDSAKEFRRRSRPLLEFLKMSVQYGKKIDQTWLAEMKELMCKRVSLPPDTSYHELMNALLNEPLKGYAGLLELVGKMDRKDEYPEGLVFHALQKRLTDWFGTSKQKTSYQEKEIEGLRNTEYDFDHSSGEFINLSPRKKIAYDNPAIVVIKNRTFCFTGKFKFGSRQKCEDAVTQRGGYSKNGMSAAVDYLVISSGEDNVNAHTSKVRDFDRLRFNGHTSQIITEEKWASFL
jgi:hypothetical protein